MELKHTTVPTVSHSQSPARFLFEYISSDTKRKYHVCRVGVILAAELYIFFLLLLFEKGIPQN